VNINYEQRNRKNYLVADIALTRDRMYKLPAADEDEESGEESQSR
jgi:hypothetical protein